MATTPRKKAAHPRAAFFVLAFADEMPGVIKKSWVVNFFGIKSGAACSTTKHLSPGASSTSQ